MGIWCGNEILDKLNSLFININGQGYSVTNDFKTSNSKNSRTFLGVKNRLIDRKAVSGF